MRKSYLKLNIAEFKDKYNVHCVHRKKVKALQNYQDARRFPGDKYIPLFVELLQDGFLDDEESHFLEYQIQKVEICAYVWAHKTKWVKREIKRIKFHQAAKPTKQLFFDFNKIRATVAVPMEILSQKSARGKSLNV